MTAILPWYYCDTSDIRGGDKLRAGCISREISFDFILKELSIGRDGTRCQKMNEVDRPLLEGVLIPDINEKLKIKTIINKLDKFSNKKKKKWFTVTKKLAPFYLVDSQLGGGGPLLNFCMIL